MKDSKPRLVWQEIQVSWTKKSRGAPGASQRNAIPERHPLSTELVGKAAKSPFCGESWTFDERSEFSPQVKVWNDEVLDPYFLRGCVRLEPQAQSVAVIFRARADLIGAPWRADYPVEVGLLEVEQRAQVAYNGRFTGEDYWWYQKTVINLALTHRTVDSNLLEQIPLVHNHREMAVLR